MTSRDRLTALVADRINWTQWGAAIRRHGITLDRPKGSTHPRHASIIYPIDYGYINDTVGQDGDEIDIFVGSAGTGLVGAIQTRDFRKGDEELKFIFNCTPEEVYLVNGFINYDRRLMEGVLLMRISLIEISDIMRREDDDVFAPKRTR